MTRRTFCVFGLMIATAWPVAVHAQTPTARTADPQVEIVQTVGCVERRSGADGTWWLTRAADPTVTKPGVFDSDQIAEIEKTAALGTLQFRLIGVPDFLSAEGLLRSGDRALFTTPEQVNATGELRDGRTVLVKGLLIDPDAEPLINLLVVVGMEDKCR